MWSSPQVLHLDEVVGSDDGGAQDQREDLWEWTYYFDELSWVLQRRKVVEQGRGFGRVIHGSLRIGTGHHGIMGCSAGESPHLDQPPNLSCQCLFQAIALPGCRKHVASRPHRR
jgi:hypothetical protein